MNLFILDKNPCVAAKLQCNKHIVKMGMECVNMLMWPLFLSGIKLPNNKEGKTVKLSHRNHPMSLWIRTNLGNYLWAAYHCMFLFDEYYARYGKKHFCEKYFDFCIDNLGYLNMPESMVKTPFPRCFGVHSADLGGIKDTVEAYRKYYLTKSSFAKWPDKSKIPEWWPDKNAVDKKFVDGRYISLT